MGWTCLGRQLESVGEYTAALEHYQQSLVRDAVDGHVHVVDGVAGPLCPQRCELVKAMGHNSDGFAPPPTLTHPRQSDTSAKVSKPRGEVAIPGKKHFFLFEKKHPGLLRTHPLNHLIPQCPPLLV